jgi:hypothetical protein
MQKTLTTSQTKFLQYVIYTYSSVLAPNYIRSINGGLRDGVYSSNRMRDKYLNDYNKHLNQ